MKLRTALFFFLLSSLSMTAHAATRGNNGSHDPSRMLQSDGKLYIYSTGGGGKSSPDGLKWQDVSSPPWNRSLPQNQGLWAPDGIHLNGKYFLFGSMWNDSKASRLVLLTTPSLDPAKAKWTDAGTVVDGPSGVTHSVIDPAPVLDADGNLYVVWGGGYPFPNDADSIFLTRLDNDTGLPLAADPGYHPPASPGYALKQGHKEGPYIHRHGEAYFLFYQTGSCCNGASSTYVIHVARANDIKGPYGDDRTFYAGNGDLHGPGHMGVYAACGVERFTYHYYPDSGGSVIGENELSWDKDGWPVPGAPSTTPLVPCGNPSGGDGNGGSSSGGNGGAGSGGSNTGGAQAGNGGVSTTGGAAGASGTGNDVGALGGASVAGSSNHAAGAAAGISSVGSSASGSANGDANAATPPNADGGCTLSRVGAPPLSVELVALAISLSALGRLTSSLLLWPRRRRGRSSSCR